MPHLHRNSYVIGLLVCCLLLSGCWDRKEIEERIFVSALGTDHSTEEGDMITFQVPIPSNLVGEGSTGANTGGEGDGGTSDLFMERAETINEASQNLKNKLSGSLYFGYAQALFIGEEKAKRGIGKFVTGLRQHPQFRREFWPIVIEGKASDFLKQGTALEQVNASLVNELILTGLRKGRIPEISLHHFLVDMTESEKRNPILNAMKINDQGKIAWSGIAVFRHDKMLDILQYDESDIVNHIREGNPGRYITVSCREMNKDVIGFRPVKANRKIRVTEKPSIQIDVYVSGNVDEESCGKKFGQRDAPEKFAKLLEDSYEKTAKRLMNKAQKRYRTDFLLLGDYIESYHHKLWKRLDWEKDFTTIPIEIKYHVTVDRFDLLIE